MVSLEELLLLLVKKGGSDLHIAAGVPPRIRVDGDLVPTDNEPMSPDDTQKIIYGLLNTNQISKFERELELDMSFGIESIGRFRVNVFRQRGNVGAVMRIIPYSIKNFEQL
ncbi:MAG TPA: type IV pili twitching motility protein PilT, partial [Planctomycetota bacterium]|nr:type IV pili twitching motility protein PilT [Planctomycetota bacterium]